MNQFNLSKNLKHLLVSVSCQRDQVGIVGQADINFHRTIKCPGEQIPSIKLVRFKSMIQLRWKN